MNRTHWILTGVVSAVILFLTIALFIGQGSGLKSRLELSVANVAAGAEAKVSVVKAESKAEIAGIKAEQTVAVGLAESKADLRIATKTASDAVDSARKTDLEASALKLKLESSTLEKEADLRKQLQEAKEEVIRCRMRQAPPSPPITFSAPPVVQYVSPTPVIVEPARVSHEVPRHIVGGPRGGQDPRTWQEAIAMFLSAANAKGDKIGAASFQAALDHRLDRGQAEFLRTLSGRVGQQDRVYLQQALVANSH